MAAPSRRLPRRSLPFSKYTPRCKTNLESTIFSLSFYSKIWYTIRNPKSVFGNPFAEKSKMSTIEVARRGQITIPKEIRDRLGIEEGQKYDLRTLEGGVLVLTPRSGRAV